MQWVGIAVAVLALLPAVSGTYTVVNNEFEYHYGPGSLLLVPYFLFLCGLALRAVIEKLKINQSARERQQAFTMLSGLFLSAAWALIFIIIIPTITRTDDLLFVGYLAPYIFTLTMYYGIIWLGFLDFRQVVARSIGYLLSLVGLGAAFILFLTLMMQTLLHDTLPPEEIIILTGISFVMAIGFQPAKRFFDKYTNRIFYRDAYDPQILYGKLNKLLVSSLDTTYILGHSASIVAESLRPEYCLIALRDGKSAFRVFGTESIVLDEQLLNDISTISPKIKSQVLMVDYLEQAQGIKLKDMMIRSNISVLVRLTRNVGEDKEDIGYIILGAKISGNPYSRDDITTLEAVSNELVLAIQNAIHFEEIQNFNVTLQGRVDEATRKYRATNEKLKKLDETKDEFISMASHQLRTPLTSVKGYLSMVLEGDVGTLNKQQEELLKQSYLSSQRMVNLIADLLNLSRLNTGKFIIDPHPIDLRDVVDSELMQLHETAKAKDIKLTYKKPDSFPILNIDENKIHQVVMNFADNAIYYTPNGGKITVELRETPTAIEYTVTDTGIGVPREVQRHLFTKFYRADNAKRARPDGTGLGLFMAKKVIIAQGGSVIFDSEEGRGSTFGFRFNKSQLAVPDPKV